MKSTGTAFTISITTKNRHAMLAETVRQLARTAAEATELLLVDDGSQPPIDPATFGPLPFPLRLIRHDTSRGLILSRNEIARECRAPFLLSCDDDSYPVEGDLAASVAYLKSRPDLIALSFPYTEGPARRQANPSRGNDPYPVRQFIGCAHLIRVAQFLALGGYWEWLVQQNEERDLCYRAWRRGWGVAHFPAVTFYHDYTPVGRNWDRHEYYTMRNEMAVELSRIPWVAVAFKLVRNGFLAVVWTLRQCRLSHVRGYLAGLNPAVVAPGRLSWRQYCTFLGRPWC